VVFDSDDEAVFSVSVAFVATNPAASRRASSKTSSSRDSVSVVSRRDASTRPSVERGENLAPVSASSEATRVSEVVAGVSLRASPDSLGASGRGGGTSRVIHASVSSPRARRERAPDRLHARPPTFRVRRSRKAGLADAPTAARTANILASQPHREVTPRPQLLAPRATRTAESPVQG
jgi:hypothetical protein